MEEFDLRDIWKQADESAGQFFEGIAPELEQRAQKRSKSTIDKVLRNAGLEMLFTVVFGIAVLFLPNLSDTLFWGLVVGNLIAIPIAAHIYKRLYDRVRAVNQATIRGALEEKINILRGFIRKLEWLTYILLPIGFFLGLGISILDSQGSASSSETLERLALTCLFSIPLLTLSVWFFKKKYIYWLYGKHLTELEELYEGLNKQD